MVLMPLSRSGSAILVCASALIADQQVSHATPRCRAIADTVVSSCRNASTAHDVALAVSRFRTPPDPLAPSHPHRPSEARSVVQQLDSAAVADRDHPAVRTASEDIVGLDLEQHAAGR